MSAKLRCTFYLSGFDSGGTSMIARVDHQPGTDKEQALNLYRKAALKWAITGWQAPLYKLTWTYVLLNSHQINRLSPYVKIIYLASWEHVETIDLEANVEEELQL